MNRPLVTVGVLVYKNFHYIKDVINSILEQDYPNIELIISDDGSPDFCAKEIENYIYEKKRKNIKSIVINEIEINGGTSKNFNAVLELAHGEFIKYLAADDLFFTANALSDMVNIAVAKNSNVVAARCPSFDQYLEKWEWTFPSDDSWNMLNNFSQKDIFGIMSEYCLISAPAVLYRTQYLKAMGGADEKYRLIEDWPLWMKMLRKGDPITFLNEYVVIYRMGGVSNGINNSSYAVHQLEYADVIANECLKYKKNMRFKHFIKAYFSEKEHRYNGNKIINWHKYSAAKKVLFLLKYTDLLIYFMYKNTSEKLKKIGYHKLSILKIGFGLYFLSIILDFEKIFLIFMQEELAFLASNSLTTVLEGFGLLIIVGILLVYLYSGLTSLKKELGAIIYGWK